MDAYLKPNDTPGYWQDMNSPPVHAAPPVIVAVVRCLDYLETISAAADRQMQDVCSIVGETFAE